MLSFADASFDTAVVTLVFRTVSDPARSLAEIHLVLTPGCTFRFIEHVRAEGLHGQVQDVLTPIQRRIRAGCHLNCRTAEYIETAGLTMCELRHPQLPLTPLILG